MVFTTDAGLFGRQRLVRPATSTARPTHTQRPPTARPNTCCPPLVTDSPFSYRTHTLRGRSRHRSPAGAAPAAGAATCGGGSRQGRGRRPVAGAAAHIGGTGRQRGRRRRPRRQGGWRPAAGAAASGGSGGNARGRRQLAAPKWRAGINVRPRRRPAAGVAASRGGGRRRGWCLEARAAAGGGGGASKGRGSRRSGWRLVAGALPPVRWPWGWNAPPRGERIRPLDVSALATPDRHVQQVTDSKPEKLSGVGIA